MGRYEITTRLPWGEVLGSMGQVALVVAAVARIDAIVNSEAIERMAGKQLR